MDAKVTGAFDKWEPTTLDVDIKPFPLRKQNQLRPQGAGKSALGLGTRSKQNYSPHIRDSGFSHPANLCRGIWNPAL